MFRVSKAVMLLLATTLAITSCKKGGEDENNTPEPGGQPGAACSGTPGTQFTAVKNIIQTHCVSCHGGSNPNGGLNLSVNCNIVEAKARIKARAVDGTPSFMPPNNPLPIADRNAITAWINAGGRVTD